MGGEDDKIAPKSAVRGDGMLKRRYDEARLERYGQGVKLYWLVDERDGAENFSMRLFEVEPQSSTPFHTHPWEHEVFIIEGEGTVRLEDGEVPFSSGDAIFIKPNEKHQFTNKGDKVLKMICVIPLKGKR